MGTSMYGGRVLGRAKQNGVKKIIMTAGCLRETKEALDLCEKYGEVHRLFYLVDSMIFLGGPGSITRTFWLFFPDPDGGFLYTTVGVHPTRCNVSGNEYTTLFLSHRRGPDTITPYSHRN